MNLPPPDSHHLNAAIGWTELGNNIEAKVELEKITPALREHPDVLEVRWQIHAKSNEWDACLEIANALVKGAPERASGYIDRSYALRRVNGKGLQAAYDALLEAREKFPDEITIAYNLACYQCQLGDLAHARTWLKRAFEIADSKTLKRMALEDSDLEPLWAEIANW